MPGILLDQEPRRLSLIVPLGERMARTGCVLFVIAFTCILSLAFLAIRQEVASGNDPSQDIVHLIHPRQNHFGFFWLIGSAAMFFVLPWYVKRAFSARIVYCFDLDTGLFTKDSKTLVPLKKIESIEVRPQMDPDGRYAFRLLVIHSDGYDVPLEESYDEERLVALAEQISSFLDVNLRVDRTVHA